MTSVIQYNCNLCFHLINTIGYTICYSQNANKPAGTYHLSSIEFGLKEMKSQVQASGAVISHICERCANDIYKEVKKRNEWIEKDTKNA